MNLPGPNPRNAEAVAELGRQVQTKEADKFAKGLLPVIDAIRGTGAITLAAISTALNERRIRTARGGRWHVSSVMNLLARANKLAQARWSALFLLRLYRWEIEEPCQPLGCRQHLLLNRLGEGLIV